MMTCKRKVKGTGKGGRKENRRGKENRREMGRNRKCILHGSGKGSQKGSRGGRRGKEGGNE
jgi:hypothetical protein